MFRIKDLELVSQLVQGTFPQHSQLIPQSYKTRAVVDVAEFHTKTCEGILPLDNDVLIHVGPATPSASKVPLEKIKVFRVPKGTMVVLKPGVWHHAPFSLNKNPANVVILLPERTYANDCTVVKLPQKSQIKIIGNK